MESYLINKLIRSKRKTLALEVTSEAHLIVRAPKYAPLEAIINFVNKKIRWISEKKRRAEERLLTRIVRKFVEGEEFLYLGEWKKLFIGKTSDCSLLYNDNQFFLSAECLPHAKEIFEQWYKKRAIDLIGERVKEFSELTGLRYSKIRITLAKRRWGSCSAKDTLSFSSRLVMAPIQIIDYVVVHELMHLKERNHSKRFWKEVASVIPEYKLSRKWLRNNGHLLTI